MSDPRWSFMCTECGRLQAVSDSSARCAGCDAAELRSVALTIEQPHLVSPSESGASSPLVESDDSPGYRG